MLYHIDESVVEAAKNNDAEVIGFLVDLEIAWQKGQCLIGASKRSFLNLKKINSLEKYSLVEKFAQGIHGLYESLDFFVVLVSNNLQVNSMSQFADKYVVMDVSSYNDIKQLHNNYLVCENVRDCDFYIICARHLLSDTLKNKYKLNIEKGNGGGGTIVDVLKSYGDYSCLAICDSDKKYPNCKIGQTLKSVLDYSKARYGIRFWMYALQVHEIENLVPLNLLNVAVKGSKSKKGKLQNLNTIKGTILRNAFLQYFDFKKGLQENILFCMKVCDKQFFDDICCQVLLQKGKTQHEIDKIVVKWRGLKKMNKKSKGKNENPVTALIAGLGDDILGDVLDYIQNNEFDPHLMKLEDYQQRDWTAIANKVWSLGCAIQPRLLLTFDK